MAGLKFSEETILSVAKTTLSNARDNLTALSEFGVNEDMLDQFDANMQIAQALPDEVSNRIELRDLTQDKEEALYACYQWGRKLRTRLQLAFGRNSSQAKSFPSSEFNSAVSSESAMMPVMEILIKLADRYSTELTDYGQTSEILAQATELLNDLRTADSAQELKKDRKKSATQERYQKFQVLYDTVNKINKIGRLVFENDPIHLPLFESKWPARSSSTVNRTNQG